jgi:hypothetical protein
MGHKSKPMQAFFFYHVGVNHCHSKHMNVNNINFHCQKRHPLSSIISSLKRKLNKTSFKYNRYKKIKI